MNTASAGYALICFDGLNMLIDQHAIVTIENIDTAQDGNEMVTNNAVEDEDDACKVYSLTAQLNPEKKTDARCRYIVVLQTDEQRFGITVDSVQSLPVKDSTLHSLPACMTLPESPIKSYMHTEDLIAFYCDVGTLWSHINTLESRHEYAT